MYCLCGHLSVVHYPQVSKQVATTARARYMQRYRWAVQDWIEDVVRDAAPDVSRVSHKPMFSYTVDPHAPGQSLRTAKWRTEKLFDAWVIAGDDDFKPLPETSARMARRKRMADRVATSGTDKKARDAWA